MCPPPLLFDQREENCHPLGGKSGRTPKITEYRLGHYTLLRYLINLLRLSSGDGAEQIVDVRWSGRKEEHRQNASGPTRITGSLLNKQSLRVERPRRQM